MDTQTLQTKDFDFELPEELIAQTPIEPRDASRLMVLDKTTGEIEHRHFHDITEYLNEGDCLVLNNSRVLPARIYGIKNETGAHVGTILAFLALLKKILRLPLWHGTKTERKDYIPVYRT